ncbi:MAG: RelA/SpoT domain-containing protein [Bryobacteraceae bacterium]
MKYRSVERYLTEIRNRVREVLTPFADSKGYALAARIKSLESVSEKVETGRFKSFAQIDDLVAFAIVVPTLADEEAVLEFLAGAFERNELHRRGSSRKAPDVFRFDGTRFIARLGRPRNVSASVTSPLFSLPFEIQIRSAFEHAWCVTTHALAYKSGDLSWGRQRLASQLRATVEQLDTLILSFDNSAKVIEPSVWPPTKAKEALRHYFAGMLLASRIPEELCPKDWSRFIENVYGLVERCGRRDDRDDIAGTIQRDLDAELRQHPSDSVPMSISLWQLTFASLFKAGTVREKPDMHWPIITPELEDLYPSLRGFGPRFDYS